MKYSQLTYLNMYLIIVIVSVKHILNFTWICYQFIFLVWGRHDVRENECLEEIAEGGKRCLQIPVHCLIPRAGSRMYQKMATQQVMYCLDATKQTKVYKAPHLGANHSKSIQRYGDLDCPRKHWNPGDFVQRRSACGVWRQRVDIPDRRSIHGRKEKDPGYGTN